MRKSSVAMLFSHFCLFIVMDNISLYHKIYLVVFYGTDNLEQVEWIRCFGVKLGGISGWTGQNSQGSRRDWCNFPVGAGGIGQGSYRKRGDWSTILLEWAGFRSEVGVNLSFFFREWVGLGKVSTWVGSLTFCGCRQRLLEFRWWPEDWLDLFREQVILAWIFAGQIGSARNPLEVARIGR